jgi:hypothetical protein
MVKPGERLFWATGIRKGTVPKYREQNRCVTWMARGDARGVSTRRKALGRTESITGKMQKSGSGANRRNPLQTKLISGEGSGSARLEGQRRNRTGSSLAGVHLLVADGIRGQRAFPTCRQNTAAPAYPPAVLRASRPSQIAPSPWNLACRAACEKCRLMPVFSFWMDEAPCQKKGSLWAGS